MARFVSYRCCVYTAAGTCSVSKIVATTLTVCTFSWENGTHPNNRAFLHAMHHEMGRIYLGDRRCFFNTKPRPHASPTTKHKKNKNYIRFTGVSDCLRASAICLLILSFHKGTGWCIPRLGMLSPQLRNTAVQLLCVSCVIVLLSVAIQPHQCYT